MNDALHRGSASPRLSRARFLAFFVGGLAALIVVSIVIVGSVAPGAPKAPCPPGQPCAPPSAPALINGKVWRSTEFGFQLEFDRRFWKLDSTDRAGIALVGTRFDESLKIRGEHSTDPSGLVVDRLDALRGNLPDLAAINSGPHYLLDPSVGYQRGVGGAYCGTFTSPQGIGTPLDVEVMAATKDGISATVTVISQTCRKQDPSQSPEYYLADQVLNTFRWPSEVQSSPTHGRT
jgi:hypothetical protein